MPYVNKKPCSIEGCKNFMVSKGLCPKHRKKQLKWGDPLHPDMRGQNRKYGPTCSVEGCEKKHQSRGLCVTHYRDARVAEDRAAGKADVYRGRDSGYVTIYVPNHPDSSKKSGKMFEHRWVMEQHLGRRLEPHENVHHINGIRDDNRIENLELWTKKQPPGTRVDDQITHAMWVLNMYAPEVLVDALGVRA